ncbi:MAG: hypothetical protein ACUVX9_05120 [Anaerolineae bacterium]
MPDVQSVLKWLEGGYWQGIAGLAQIVAVVFAVVAARQSRDAAKQAANTMEQGRKLIAETMALVRLAEAQRLLSVEPDWEAVVGPNHTRVHYSEPTGSHRTQLEIALRNTGFGPARHPSLCYQGEAKVEITDIRISRGKATVVFPGEDLLASIWWPETQRLTGVLRVSALSKLGTEVVRDLEIEAAGTRERGEGVRIWPIAPCRSQRDLASQSGTKSSSNVGGAAGCANDSGVRSTIPPASISG